MIPPYEKKTTPDLRTWERISKGTHHWIAKDAGKVPSVMCDCGNTTFQLVYGHYELFAVCSQCGNKDVVYDG